MELTIPPAALVPFGLRALKTVAMANGKFDVAERALLDAAQQMFAASVDIDELPTITPEELASAVLDVQLRRQLVFGMLMTALADGDATTDEASAIEAFAAALGVEAHEIATFREISEGHLMHARLDVLRRFWVRPFILEEAKRGGVTWLVKALVTFAGVSEDRALADRYRALGELPEGTLGRTYVDHMRADGFSLPGEKGSPPEPIVVHDLTHVLSGYGTDPAGEICVTAFSAGFRKQDPFTFILFSMMQFNLGIRMTPAAAATRYAFEPKRVLEAIRRGAAMNRDITDQTWDYWADFPLPIEEVRAKYGIGPLGR